MLIAIEGIDGAGKTHIARLLAEKLGRLGCPSCYLNKSDIAFGDEFADDRLHLLREILWPAGGEPSQDLLGTHFYLFMLAGWFSALNQTLRRQRAAAETITIMDGSHYRVIAKAHRRAGIPRDRLTEYFTSAAEPDLVVFLEIDPDVAWGRRATFKETEMGRWDGHRGNPRDNYCAYQSSIQTELSQFADERDWLTIRQDQDTVDTNVVDRILRHIDGWTAKSEAAE